MQEKIEWCLVHVNIFGNCVQEYCNIVTHRFVYKLITEHAVINSVHVTLDQGATYVYRPGHFPRPLAWRIRSNDINANSTIWASCTPDVRPLAAPPLMRNNCTATSDIITLPKSFTKQKYKENLKRSLKALTKVFLYSQYPG